MNRLEEKINSFVGGLLDGYIPEKNDGKFIHDPIWGSVFYSAWEVQIIDSPVVQRLRGIHQLGMADLTYTAARHSRFEHSLGTCAIAGRMAEQLKKRSKIYAVSEFDVNTVRLAAILHDVGHCFYSHLSERVYASVPEFAELMNEKCIKCAPHEFMSYLIITSEAFSGFFFDHVDFPDKEKHTDVLIRAANIVVGKKNYDADGNGQTFLTSVLNGEFDADKLDYTQRDSYTAGIAMTYGVDRFLMKIMIAERDEDGRKDYVLAADSDALTTIEELIFNRSILYVYMYRHQKVLATESSLRDVVLGMANVGLLNDPADFLKYSDSNIENFDTVDKIPFEEQNNLLTLGGMIKKIETRKLPKRVAEFSLEKTGKSTGTVEDYVYMKSFIEKISGNIDRIREEIFESICNVYYKRGKIVDFTLFDIYVCFPEMIKTRTDFLLVSKDGRVRSIAEIKYIRDWAESFAAEKWRGYVFCNSNVDRIVAAECSEEYISRFY